jgi:DNA-binding CsgD family transcriptional regulator
MKGGSVVDPSLIKEVLGAKRRDDPLAALSDREREVLALIAEGRSNIGIARALWVTETTVQKHVQHILTKLRLPPSSDDHRRVLAVLTWLGARSEGPSISSRMARAERDDLAKPHSQGCDEKWRARVSCLKARPRVAAALRAAGIFPVEPWGGTAPARCGGDICTPRPST